MTDAVIDPLAVMVKILVERGQTSKTRPLAKAQSPLNLRPYLSHKVPNVSFLVVRALLVRALWLTRSPVKRPLGTRPI